MNKKTIFQLWLVAGLSTLLGGAWLNAAGGTDDKPSSYAPAKELVSQVEFFVGRMSDDLADEKAYEVEQQGRLTKDACTVAALVMVLGKHDEATPIKPVAKSVVAAANELAKSAKDYAAAKDKLTKLKQLLASKESGEPVEWAPAGDLAELMKQVPVINNGLRRNVTGRRFQQTTEASIGAATTLAALAQVSTFDTTWCEDEAGEKRWGELCVQMRDAAAEIRAAVQKADQKGATGALEKMTKACDACHEEFRDK